MKKLVNPTTYFFEQADKVPEQNCPEIQKFVENLLEKDKCELCLNLYDMDHRIPRILIHCGHTFCTPCLEKENSVRCPMCLKLVKELDSLTRLPINHTIFAHLVEKHKKESLLQNREPIIEDATQYLYAEFERVQKEAHLAEHPQRIDDESGLPFCVFHSDRVEHFFCEFHKIFGCRVCVEIGHSRPECKIIDLYTVDDPSRYQSIMEARIQEPEQSGTDNRYLNNENQLGRYGNIMDQDLMDDSESDDNHRSL